MYLYARDISKRLLLLRLIMMTTIAIIILLFRFHSSDYAIFLILIIIILSVFSVTTISIYPDYLKITKFYLLGYLPIRRRFSRDNLLEVYPLKAGTEEEHPALGIDSDTLLDFFKFLFPKLKGISYLLVIKFMRNDGITGLIELPLTAEEYDRICNLAIILNEKSY